MVKKLTVLLCILFLNCNDSVKEISTREVPSQNIEDNWVILDTNQTKSIVVAWKKRKRMSDFGSPSYMFYNNQNHKIVKIEFVNSKVIEFEISGTIVLFKGDYYHLDIDTTIQVFPQN